jgi:multidrug resistance efflux pump
MIIFLTLCYCAFLFILVKIGIIKLNSFWKASPLIWMTLLLIFLFIPMNWGAPSGPVMLYQIVVSVTPNVSGEVTELHATPGQPMKKGDVLFKLDPTVYQATVDQLTANLELSQTRLDQSERLFARGAGSEYDVQRYRADVLSIEAQLASARWNLENCTVLAPDDGFPIGVTLAPGNRVTQLQSAMAYVITERALVIGIQQIYVRHIKVGQPVEITMKLIPGKIVTAVVDRIVMMTPQGQLLPTGQVPLAPTGQDPPAPFAVVVVPDEASMALIGA